MLRSMYAGISGLKSNQTKLDVVGNNVANASTTSYKKSSIRFSDSLYQMNGYASRATDEMGGINPSQVGLGSKVSAISKNIIQGPLETTGNTTDFAIDGDGYFAVQKGDVTSYTRDGSFVLDENGDLVTASGHFVLDRVGNKINIPDEVAGNNVVSFTVSSDGRISYSLASGEKSDGQQIQVATFKNPAGLESIGDNMYSPSANSGNAVIGDSYGSVKQGALEMSNVDLSEEFTSMIVTTRAFQASSKVITTSDELLQEIINLKR